MPRRRRDRLGVRGPLAHRAEVEAVAAVVGARQFNTYEHQITGQLDGTPWIGAIATVHRGNNYGLACLAQMLQAACYIVIVYLPGMRESEIRHLRRG